MESILCKWGDMHEHGPLWYEHLKVRKRVFVDNSGWGVPHTQDVEWDQFDTPATLYCITHLNGRVLASSRAIPCDFETPTSSYMIRDACRGLLPGIPPEVFSDPPVSGATWEATRFSVNPDLATDEKYAAMRKNAQDLLAGMASEGATEALALMPPGFVAWFKRNGIPARRLGPVTFNAQRDKFCVIGVDTSSAMGLPLLQTA